jgi:ABC-type bacteriocin/lantibiotic exporter with double-glycine peptidase domain
MSKSLAETGLRVDQMLDRVRRDVSRADDSLSISRVIGQNRTDLKSDNWVDLLCHVADDLDLRANRGEGTLEEATEWAMPEMPVVLSIGEGNSRKYLIIHDHFGGRVLVTLGPDPFRSTWISRRELENRLKLGRDQRIVWVSFATAQTALQVDPADKPTAGRPHFKSSVHVTGNDQDHFEDHGSPFTQLIQIIRPEMKDIRVIGIYALATSILGLASPLAVEALVATVGFRMLLQQVVVLTLVLFVFLSLAAALFTIQKYVVEVIQRRLFVRIVADFAFRLPRAKIEAFDHHYGPELMNRFFDVMTMQKTLAGLLTDGVYLIITTVLGLAIMGFYHPYLLGFDIVLLSSIAFVILIMGRGGVRTSIGESRAKYETAAWLEELSRLSNTMKHFQGKDLAMERADALARSYLDARRSHFRIVYRQVLFSAMLQVIASTTLLGLGGWLVIKGQLTLGQLVASELIVTIVVGSFAKLGKYIEDFYDLLASANKLGHIIALEVEPDSGDPLPDTGKPAVLEIHEVTGSSHHDHPMFGPVSLQVNSGEKIALSGPSGCGKSMLLSMIAGQRIASSGQVLVDSLDVRDIRLDSLRQQVAYITDESTMEGTVIENIRMGRDALSLREVRWALDVTGLSAKIDESEAGLYQRIGPAGLGISRGEASRLLIARAIVGRPRLLLIDGHLDSLDRENADRILDVLTAPEASWTLILVTQSAEIQARMSRVIQLEPTHHSSRTIQVANH